MHVIKQILTVFPSTSSGEEEEEEEEEKRKKKRRKKNKKQQQQKDLLLQCVSYSNWDGESRKTMGGAFVLPQEKALEMKAKLLPAIAALLKSSSTSRGGGGKPMDFEITVDDDQFDSDEYDTQWSSIEILIYTYHNNDGHDSNGGISKEEGEKAATGAESNSVKQQRQLSARIHRRAYLTQNPGGTTRQPKNLAVEAVFGALEDVCKFGRVEEFSEKGGLKVADSETTSLAWHGYHMPIYLAH